MSERTAVHVDGTDPVLVSGVATMLRSRPDLHLGELEAVGSAGVVVLVGDTVTAELLQRMRDLRGPRRVHNRLLLVLTAIDDAELMRAVEAGAGGVVPRAQATAERLNTAVTQLAAAGGALSARLVGRLIDQVARLQQQSRLPSACGRYGFSDRQTEVFRLISEGHEVREIAQKLSYSERTIKKDVHEVLNRFQLRNRAHAVAFALREGLI